MVEAFGMTSIIRYSNVIPSYTLEEEYPNIEQGEIFFWQIKKRLIFLQNQWSLFLSATIVRRLRTRRTSAPTQSAIKFWLLLKLEKIARLRVVQCHSSCWLTTDDTWIVIYASGCQWCWRVSYDWFWSNQ